MTRSGDSALRVAHLDSGREWRGGQAQALLLMTGLGRHGVRNVLLAPHAPLLERAQAHGVEACVWRARGDLDLVALWRARALLVAKRPQVVHCHDARAHALGVVAARMAKVPVVVVSRRVMEAVPRGWWRALKYRMPVDRYLCVSRSVMEAMRAAGLPESRLACIPDGVDPAPGPATANLRRLAGIPDDVPVVATVAALTEEKRHEDLLDAAALVVAAVPRAHFAWLGDGPRRAWLVARRDRAGLAGHVHLLGFREDASALVRQATLVALASEHEGMGSSLIEAQLVGVPVVATRVGGIPEVVEDGVSGRLVPPRDPRVLAQVLIGLLGQPEVARAMGEAGVRRAGEFHIGRTVERTLKEYLVLLGEAGRAA